MHFILNSVQNHKGMKLSLGFSPCPNDTFIFDAMIHGKVDTEGLEFDVVLADVEELNQKAFAQKLDITKLSYHAFAYLLDDYLLLDAGSALGNGVGPLLIAKREFSQTEVDNATIAIPGKYTTANFLFSLAYPKAVHKQELLFSDIENAVLQGKVDLGLIIHENRFTYHERGLVKIRDLGEFWEETFALPIPLGGIVIRQGLSRDVQEKVNRILQRSVQFALENPEQTMDYVRPHAQEMDEKVMLQHINLYVNDYTVNLGDIGKEAVRRMFEVAREKQIIPPYSSPIFLHPEHQNVAI